jgi:hypothetical protein
MRAGPVLFFSLPFFFFFPASGLLRSTGLLRKRSMRFVLLRLEQGGTVAVLVSPDLQEVGKTGCLLAVASVHCGGHEIWSCEKKQA